MSVWEQEKGGFVHMGAIAPSMCRQPSGMLAATARTAVAEPAGGGEGPGARPRRAVPRGGQTV